MSFWTQLEAMVERYGKDLAAAKRAGRRTGWVRVKCAPSGVWSARRASRYGGGVFELHERSADALIVGMFLGRHRGERRR